MSKWGRKKVVQKTDENYGKGEAKIKEGETLDPVLKEIRLEVKEAISKSDFEIPLLPHVATQVLQMANNPRASLADMESLVKTDQVIAAKIIKTANSPFYRGVSQILSLRDAMSRIGLKQMKDIVFSLSVHSKVFKVKGFEKVMDNLWDHSVACAGGAQVIARAANKESEAAFLAGLLHDIGKAVLVNVIAEILKRHIKEGKRTTPESIIDYVLPLVFEEYHAVVGALVAAKWKMPNRVIEVIRFHHEPIKAKEDPNFVQTVYLANVLCHHFGFGHDEDPIILHHEKSFEKLEIKTDRIEKIADDFYDNVNKLRGSL